MSTQALARAIQRARWAAAHGYACTIPAGAAPWQIHAIVDAWRAIEQVV